MASCDLCESNGDGEETSFLLFFILESLVAIKTDINVFSCEQTKVRCWFSSRFPGLLTWHVRGLLGTCWCLTNYKQVEVWIWKTSEIKKNSTIYVLLQRLYLVIACLFRSPVSLPWYFYLIDVPWFDHTELL